MKRSAPKRRTPLQPRTSWLKRTTPIRKSGPRKAKRIKRQRAHYASKYWKTVRYLVWQRDAGICQDCGLELDAMTEMDAAHRTNARFGKENLDDVKCSCRPCNQKERASRSWYAGPVY